jgi:hypothetical protein
VYWDREKHSTITTCVRACVTLLSKRRINCGQLFTSLANIVCANVMVLGLLGVEGRGGEGKGREGKGRGWLVVATRLTSEGVVWAGGTELLCVWGYKRKNYPNNISHCI